MIFRNRIEGKNEEILREISEEKFPELKDKSFHNERDQVGVIKRLYGGKS